MSLIYLFPGQGSQHKGMGSGLFERFPELTREAEGQLGYSLVRLCLEDPENQLRQTRFTQPALYVVNALSYLAKVEDGGREPGFLAGHSLGEYDALFAARVFDFLTGLKLVQKRGELMAQADGGAMAAIAAFPPQQVGELLENFGFDTIDVANYNSDNQTVIAGPAAEIEEALPIFKEAGATVVPLKVSGAFHSRMMRPFQDQFRDYVAGFVFAPPARPVIANLSAQPYTLEAVSELLVGQLASPVRWSDSMRYLLREPEATFEEVGPGKVLTGLIQQIQNHRAPPA